MSYIWCIFFWNKSLLDFIGFSETGVQEANLLNSTTYPLPGKSSSISCLLIQFDKISSLFYDLHEKQNLLSKVNESR
jgi:hypothetical protein